MKHKKFALGVFVQGGFVLGSFVWRVFVGGLFLKFSAGGFVLEPVRNSIVLAQLEESLSAVRIIGSIES